MFRITGILILLVMLGSSACATFGPATVARDRMDYMEAIADSWKRMMLLNIIKLRYGDAPVFLEVASIINQYALETEISASASWNAFLPTDSQALGGKGRYSDRPTITYNPLMGQEFTQRLMEPIPTTKFASLLQTGYSAEFLFHVCVSAINGIQNESNMRLMTHEADPRFEQLVDAMARIQKAGGLGMRMIMQNENEFSAIFFRRELSGELAEDTALVKGLLGLDPDAHEYRVVYGSIAGDDQEIAILTRSMLQITGEVAARVDVPACHIEENRASPSLYSKADSALEKRTLVKIRSSIDEPDDAFVAIRYRGYWFYVDDRDFISKRMFSFLMFVFTLVETSSSEKAPLLTIPTG